MTRVEATVRSSGTRPRVTGADGSDGSARIAPTPRGTERGQNRKSRPRCPRLRSADPWPSIGRRIEGAEEDADPMASNAQSKRHLDGTTRASIQTATPRKTTPKTCLTRNEPRSRPRQGLGTDGAVHDQRQAHAESQREQGRGATRHVAGLGDVEQRPSQRRRHAGADDQRRGEAEDGGSRKRPAHAGRSGQKRGWSRSWEAGARTGRTSTARGPRTPRSSRRAPTASATQPAGSARTRPRRCPGAA